jgi:protein TonB
MEAKKNPKLRLERWRSAFFQIGLIVSIVFVISAFEWKFYERVVVVEGGEASQVEEVIIPITEIPPPEPPKPKVMVKEFFEAVEEEEMDIPEIEIIIDQEEVIKYTPPPILDPEIEEEISDQPFLIVEDMPMPLGGYTAFYQYVSENMKYPNRAINLGVEGVVFLQFVVNEKGEIVNPVVVKGIGAGCDEEALRVLKSAPDWKPGKQRGREVKVQIVVPIRFILVKR